MTCAFDLYQMNPVEVSNDFGCLSGFYYDHIPELEYDYYLKVQESDLIEIRYLKNHCFDGRRVWQLATVWFDGYPVMVIQNAGRGGDDFSDRYITDVERFKQMIQHIKYIQPVGEPDLEQVDSMEDIPALTKFYGNRLDGKFEGY